MCRPLVVRKYCLGSWLLAIDDGLTVTEPAHCAPHPEVAPCSSRCSRLPNCAQIVPTKPSSHRRTTPVKIKQALRIMDDVMCSHLLSRPQTVLWRKIQIEHYNTNALYAQRHPCYPNLRPSPRRKPHHTGTAEDPQRAEALGHLHGWTRYGIEGPGMGKQGEPPIRSTIRPRVWCLHQQTG